MAKQDKNKPPVAPVEAPKAPDAAAGTPPVVEAPKAPEPPAEKPAKAAKSTVTMYAPEGGGDVSHGGQTYELSKDGTVEVPPGAVADLRDHGYVTDKPKGAK